MVAFNQEASLAPFDSTTKNGFQHSPPSPIMIINNKPIDSMPVASGAVPTAGQIETTTCTSTTTFGAIVPSLPADRWTRASNYLRNRTAALFSRLLSSGSGINNNNNNQQIPLVPEVAPASVVTARLPPSSHQQLLSSVVNIQQHSSAVDSELHHHDGINFLTDYSNLAYFIFTNSYHPHHQNSHLHSTDIGSDNEDDGVDSGNVKTLGQHQQLQQQPQQEEEQNQFARIL